MSSCPGMKYERKMTTFDHSHDFLEATMTIAVLMKYLYNTTKMTYKKVLKQKQPCLYFKRSVCHLAEAARSLSKVLVFTQISQSLGMTIGF